MKTINNERKIQMKTYTFLVPCSFEYEIEAKTEEQARKILAEQGGIDIQGERAFILG